MLKQQLDLEKKIEDQEHEKQRQADLVKQKAEEKIKAQKELEEARN